MRLQSWHCQFVGDSGALLEVVETATDHRSPSLIVLPIDYEENKKVTERIGEMTCPI